MATRHQQQRISPNKMQSHEIGQLVKDNWNRIEYVCNRQTDRTMSAIGHGRKYDKVACIEWISPEGMLFWLFVDYRHVIPVLLPVIVGGTENRPQFFSPQTLIDSGGGRIDCYSCHFMERYRQRTTRLQLPMKEVVKHYFIHNISSLCIWHDEADDHRVFAVKQGIIFAKADRTYNRWIYTTYVSNDMLGDAQREAKAVMQKLLDRQDTLYNGTHHYQQQEWDILDAYINERTKQLRPLAQEIYNSYYEDADE